MNPKHSTTKQRIEEWQFNYNYRRSHGSLKGLTLAQWAARFDGQVPLWDEVLAQYDATSERIRLSNWSADQSLAKLHVRRQNGAGKK